MPFLVLNKMDYIWHMKPRVDVDHAEWVGLGTNAANGETTNLLVSKKEGRPMTAADV